MKKVVCVDDLNLPPGGAVQDQKVYEVLEDFVNQAEQRVYILKGVNNEGFTKFGMKWVGYNAKRFMDVEFTSDEQKEVNLEEAVL